MTFCASGFFVALRRYPSRIPSSPWPTATQTTLCEQTLSKPDIPTKPDHADLIHAQPTATLVIYWLNGMTANIATSCPSALPPLQFHVSTLHRAMLRTHTLRHVHVICDTELSRPDTSWTTWPLQVLRSMRVECNALFWSLVCKSSCRKSMVKACWSKIPLPQVKRTVGANWTCTYPLDLSWPIYDCRAWTKN